MFERFRHLLTKELHDRGFSRLDPVGEPLPVERHGAWEWTFHKIGPELNHYVIAALIPLGEPSTKTGRVLRVEIAIGADTRERNPRWTPENRPVVDGAKPASGAEPQARAFYRVRV
jgi:hypothetical protein